MSARRDSAFSLIEVLVATGAFVIVFLAGSNGLVRIWMRQEQVHQGSLASAAALVVADWHAAKALADPGRPGLVANLAGLADPEPVAGVTWYGPATTPGTGFQAFRFRASATPTSGPAIDLSAYRQMVFTVASGGHSGGMGFALVAFWSLPDTGIGGLRVPAQYLGHVIMPESAL